MGKHERNNLREWWADFRWNAKHGQHDWMIPIGMAIIGTILWHIIF